MLLSLFIPERGSFDKPIIKTQQTFAHPGFRKDYTGLGTLASEADAIRSAAELREHVDGVKPFEGVLAWTNDQVCYFPVDWPPSASNEDGRFYRLWSDPSDLSVISFDEAREKQKAGQCVHIGQAPRTRECAVAREAGAGDGADKYILTFIEFCCSNLSKASDNRYNRRGARLI